MCDDLMGPFRTLQCIVLVISGQVDGEFLLCVVI